jgi:hypothetical protein
VFPGSVSHFEACLPSSTTSIMAASIQFVNFTSDSSNAAQKAQQRLIRSHVATQRERLKRLRSSKTASQLPYQQAILPTTWLSENNPAAPLANHSKQRRKYNAPSVRNASCTTSPSSLEPDATLEQSSETGGLSVVDDDNALVPVRESGDGLLPLDISSFDQYLGQGGRDWFVQMPRMTSPRMAKHLYYCTMLSSHRVFRSNASTDVAELMPKLNPTYSVSRLRGAKCVTLVRHSESLPTRNAIRQL